MKFATALIAAVITLSAGAGFPARAADGVETAPRGREPLAATAFFVVNFTSQKDPVFKAAARAYAPIVAQSYASSHTFVASEPDQAAGDPKRLLQQIEQAARSGNPIDLYIFSHQNALHLWLARLPEHTRRQIRLVYNAGCNTKQYASSWLDLGVGGFIGHGDNSASPLFIRRFQAEWTRGADLETAVHRANQGSKRELKAPGLQQFAEGTPALVAGNLRLRFTAPPAIARKVLPTLTLLPGREWQTDAAHLIACSNASGPFTSAELQKWASGAVNTLSCGSAEIDEIAPAGDLRNRTLFGATVFIPASATRLQLDDAFLISSTLTPRRGDSFNLARSSLKRATIRNLSLTGANLSGSDFSGASLHAVRLRSCNLAGADFRGATLTETYFEWDSFTEACTSLQGFQYDSRTRMGMTLRNQLRHCQEFEAEQKRRALEAAREQLLEERDGDGFVSIGD